MAQDTMLYKYPGATELHGGRFDYIIVDADADGALAAALADGWKLTTPEAKAAHDEAVAAAAAAREAEAEAAAAKALADDTKPPTRAELEQMATSLGLPFDGRTSDKKLAKLIEAAAQPADPAPVAPAPEAQLAA
jgi:hypothetical protein